MANKVHLSEQFKLKAADFLKGLILAVGTPVLYLLQEMIPGWEADPFVKAALSAFVTYLLKNLVEPAKVITTYSSNEKATQVANEIKQS